MASMQRIGSNSLRLVTTETKPTAITVNADLDGVQALASSRSVHAQHAPPAVDLI